MEELEQLLQAARNGDREAIWKVGDFYREAKPGVKYSPKTAFRWYAESALAGSATGQNNVGAAFENGVGCEQSYAKAAKWYRLSAAQGCGVAMANLGFLYLYGFGVKPNRKEALGWFKRAAALGCPRSKRILKTVRADD
jgi:TPR repeat protein